MKYKQELSRQLALDYCCNAEDILDNKNHFNVYEQRDGRRRFEEQDDCVLKVIVVNEKLIFTGKKEIVNICKEKYESLNIFFPFGDREEMPQEKLNELQKLL